MPTPLTSPGDSLTAAIRRKWDGSGVLTAAVKRLYLEEVPERDEDDKSIDLPYAWCDVGKSRFDWTTEAQYYEYNAVDFHALAAGAAQAEALAELIFDTFAWQPLSFHFATNVSVYFMPTDRDLKSEMFRYKDNSIVFRVTSCF